MSLLIYGIDNYYNISFERIVDMLLWTPVFGWKVNSQSKAKKKTYKQKKQKTKQTKNCVTETGYQKQIARRDKKKVYPPS